MSDFADAIVRDILARAEPVARRLATDVQSDLVSRCSVPVGHQGRRVVRSRPGEPPRRETGSYIGRIRTEFSAEGDRLRATVFTDDPRGQWFTEGTSRMAPRPHWREAAELWADEAVRRFNDSMSGPSGN